MRPGKGLGAYPREVGCQQHLWFTYGRGNGSDTQGQRPTGGSHETQIQRSPPSNSHRICHPCNRSFAFHPWGKAQKKLSFTSLSVSRIEALNVRLKPPNASGGAGRLPGTHVTHFRQESRRFPYILLLRDSFRKSAKNAYNASRPPTYWPITAPDALAIELNTSPNPRSGSSYRAHIRLKSHGRQAPTKAV